MSGKYSDAFVEHMVQSYKGGCSDIAPSCYVGCSCAEGWTAGSARQNSDGSWTTSFANENNGDNIWAIDRRHNGGAYNSTQLACYKAGCESGYYVERPSSSIFIEKQSSTEKHGLPCFKAVGCKAGFTTEKIDGAESYTYHGFTCYKQEECPDGYFKDKPNTSYFTYKTSSNCYKATGCKEGYTTEKIEGTESYTYHGFTCYKNKESSDGYFCSKQTGDYLNLEITVKDYMENGTRRNKIIFSTETTNNNLKNSDTIYITADIEYKLCESSYSNQECSSKVQPTNFSTDIYSLLYDRNMATIFMPIITGYSSTRFTRITIKSVSLNNGIPVGGSSKICEISESGNKTCIEGYEACLIDGSSDYKLGLLITNVKWDTTLE